MDLRLNKETLLLGKVLDFVRSVGFYRPEWPDLYESGDPGIYPLQPHLGDATEFWGCLNSG
jgi:hypothetical protein